MCVIILGLILVLLYYSYATMVVLKLAESIEQQDVFIAQGWEIALEIWPLLLLFFLLGIFFILLFFRFRSMWHERRRRKQENS